MMTFRLGDVPVSIQPWFWALAVVLGLANEITGAGLGVWVAVVFVSVLVHELGHAVVIRGFGYAPRIVLHFIGGLTTWVPVEELAPRRRVASTLAGPAAGFLLAGAAWALRELTTFGESAELVADALLWLLVVNVIWGVFNLIPIRGLDGGQAVRGLLELMSPRYGPRIAEAVYIAVGLAAIVFGIVRGFLILAVLAAVMTFGSYAGDRSRRPPQPGSPTGTGAAHGPTDHDPGHEPKLGI